MLEPMASQVHFCLIGVGEEFFVHRAAALASKASKGHAVPTVEALRYEYYHGIATIFDFFQKRDFKHVSFLEGGFTAAIRYLMKEECPYSIGSALVDVEGDTLDAVFGAGTAASFLNSRRPGGAGGGSAGAQTAVAAAGSSGFLSSLSKADIFAKGGSGDVVEVTAAQSQSKGATATAATGGGCCPSCPPAVLHEDRSCRCGGGRRYPGRPCGQGGGPLHSPSRQRTGCGSAGRGRPEEQDESLRVQHHGLPAEGVSVRRQKRAGQRQRGVERLPDRHAGRGRDHQHLERGGGGKSHPQRGDAPMQREASAFVIDDDDDDEEEGGDEGREGRRQAAPAAAPVDKSKASSFITRVGGAMRSSAAAAPSMIYKWSFKINQIGVHLCMID
jgi:hypothetical protein